MKKIYSSQLLPMVGHLRNVLEAHGIECLVKNEFGSSGMGELPPIEVWPELWVLDDRQFDEAVSIVSVAALDNGVTATQRWTCNNCGEQLEGQFTDCWKCGRSRPD
ncbi:MAG: hypothetical protein CMO26_00170 [Thiotrichales bacterium]|nr:hypothetical protein [Thiotrichales bacterium]|tara:strand:+ start:763 stop:1080 length:318 start_codon:yes stop_codon:yes gene_type:complete